MSNSNCLTGFRCPECGSEGPFSIEALSLFTVYDEGTDDHSDVQWDDNSYCQCVECCHSGTVLTFQSTEDEEQDDETAA